MVNKRTSNALFVFLVLIAMNSFASPGETTGPLNLKLESLAAAIASPTGASREETIAEMLSRYKEKVRHQYPDVKPLDIVIEPEIALVRIRAPSKGQLDGAIQGVTVKEGIVFICGLLNLRAEIIPERNQVIIRRLK